MKPVDVLTEEIERKLHIVPKANKPVGKDGRLIQLYTNHFPMIFNGKRAIHYDVAFTPDRPVKMLPAVVEQFRRKHFNNRFPAFDGRKNLYSESPLIKGDSLTDDEVNILDSDGRTMTFKVTIKQVNLIDLSVLGTSAGTPEQVKNAKQCLEIVLRTASSKMYMENAMQVVPVGRNVYTPSHNFDLRNGMEMFMGIFQAVTLGEKLFVNIDVTCKAFAKEMNVVDLVKEQNFRNQQILEKPMRDFEIEKLKEHLYNLKVQYMVPNMPSSKRKVTVVGVRSQPADREMFIHENTRMSVADYYKNIRKYTLKYPNLPCLHVGNVKKAIYYPLELCTVLPNQAVQKKMQQDPQVIRELIKYANTDTENRKNRIQNLRNSNKWNEHPSLKEFQITVSNKMQQLDGRVLRAPQLIYNNGSVEVVEGVWESQKFQTAIRIDRWMVLCLDKNCRPGDIGKLIQMVRLNYNVSIKIS